MFSWLSARSHHYVAIHLGLCPSLVPAIQRCLHSPRSSSVILCHLSRTLVVSVPICLDLHLSMAMHLDPPSTLTSVDRRGPGLCHESTLLTVVRPSCSVPRSERSLTGRADSRANQGYTTSPFDGSCQRTRRIHHPLLVSMLRFFPLDLSPATETGSWKQWTDIQNLWLPLLGSSSIGLHTP